MDLTKYGFREGFDQNNKVVKQETIEFEGKNYFVSTVDLGFNHQYGEGPPLYYETMIFPEGTFQDMYCNRYSERDSALSAHESLVCAIGREDYEILDGYFYRKGGDTRQ